MTKRQVNSSDAPLGTVTHLVVEEGPQRLDNFLRRTLKGVPDALIYRIIRSGEVRVDGHRAKPTTKVATGQVVRVPPLRLATPSVPAPVPPQGGVGRLPVLFEDEALLVVDKPAGIAVHGGSGVAWGLIEWVRAHWPQAARWELVHRLDRDTSGVLVIAKTRRALKGLQADWRVGAVQKRYWALAVGVLKEPRLTVRAALERYVTAQGERRVRVSTGGKESASEVRRLAWWEGAAPGFSLVEVALLTGRTHQIRAHLAHVGYPLVGDEKYGDFSLNKVLARQMGASRLFLHAASLAFPHPLTGVRVTCAAPLPPELRALLARLGHPSGGRVPC